MAKYHMKPNGEPGKCTASVKACPLGEEAIHGNSPQDVYEKFEQAMKQHIMPTTVKKEPVLKPSDAMIDPYKGNTVQYSEPYWSWDAKREGCSYKLRGEDCPDSYMCHHQTYQEVFLTEQDVRGQLAEALGLKTLPAELQDQIDWSNTDDLFVVERGPDYYGESINVRLRKSVAATIESYHYARPNVGSYNGGLEFARVNGVDTSGKNEVQALKSLAASRLPKDVSSKVASATHATKQVVSLNKIKTVKSKLAKATAAPITMKNTTGYNAGGVLVANGDGSYTLVSGDYSRFKAFADGGRKSANFFILSTPKAGDRWREPSKEPLNAGPIDTTSW